MLGKWVVGLNFCAGKPKKPPRINLKLEAKPFVGLLGLFWAYWYLYESSGPVLGLVYVK